MTNFLKAISILVVIICSLGSNGQAVADQPDVAAAQPNIIIILSDDMGYSDIGCYGSEIQTPTLDGLAKNGLAFTQFYNTGRCCPTRAALLTGHYPHTAGSGTWLPIEAPRAIKAS